MPALASSRVGSLGISGLDGTSRWSRSTKKSVNRRRIWVEFMVSTSRSWVGLLERLPPNRAGALGGPAPRLGELSSQLRLALGHGRLPGGQRRGQALAPVGGRLGQLGGQGLGGEPVG